MTVKAKPKSKNPSPGAGTFLDHLQELALRIRNAAIILLIFAGLGMYFADPILRLGDIKGGGAVRTRCEELARQVGLPIELLDRFPHQLSGGQKARVGIARAIALSPELVILDEPTAALDVSVQAVVLNLLQDLKDSLGMSYLFVSHDLNVVRLLCDRVIVMRAGRIVEQGPTARVLGSPESDYTRELLSAIPHPPM